MSVLQRDHEKCAPTTKSWNSEWEFSKSYRPASSGGNLLTNSVNSPQARLVAFGADDVQDVVFLELWWKAKADPDFLVFSWHQLLDNKFHFILLVSVLSGGSSLPLAAVPRVRILPDASRSSQSARCPGLWLPDSTANLIRPKRTRLIPQGTTSPELRIANKLTKITFHLILAIHPIALFQLNPRIHV